MGWKTIKIHRYYYKSERVGSRVKTAYFGAGESGLLISLLQLEDRAEREAGSERTGNRPVPDRLRTVNILAGAESDGAGLSVGDSETAAEWLREDPEFIAALNRAKSFRRERLQADVRSLASDAMATLRELVSGPHVPPAVRLRASLAILEAADALKIGEIGPMSTEGVEAELDDKRFIESLGG